MGVRISIRLATSNDYKRYMELMGEFVNDQARFSNWDNDSFHIVLHDNSSFIYVCENETDIIGFIVFSIRSVVRYSSPIIEVEEIFVSARFQRQGIGRLLIQKSIEIGRENKCSYVFLASDKKREFAHLFHHSMEFVEYGYHYRLKL